MAFACRFGAAGSASLVPDVGERVFLAASVEREFATEASFDAAVMRFIQASGSSRTGKDSSIGPRAIGSSVFMQIGVQHIPAEET